MGIHTKATGTVLLAILSGDKIVLVRQPSKPPPILWKLPGGRIKNLEQPVDTAIREAKEELDITLAEVQIQPLREFPQNGYTQYLFSARVFPDVIEKQSTGLVRVIDPENIEMESTCFDMKELQRSPDFMPKHLQFLKEAGVFQSVKHDF